MSSPAERKAIKDLFKKLQKRYTEISPLLDEKHEVLELLIFASFLENTSIKTALDSFSILERYFVDWNEIRVSSANELADLFCHVHSPSKTGERIRRILQMIFDIQNNKFDLEELRAKTEEEIVAFFEPIRYSTVFMNQFVTMVLGASNTIPLDEGAWRVLRLLECVSIDQENHEKACGLDIFTSAKDRLNFFILFHNLSAEMMDEEKMEAAIQFLKTVDPKADVRSWLPLVENDIIDDPFLIAKQMRLKERNKRPYPVISMDDEDDIGDGYDSGSIDDENDNSYCEPDTEFSDSSADSINYNKEEEDFVYSDDDSTEAVLGKNEKSKNKGKEDDKVKKKEKVKNSSKSVTKTRADSGTDTREESIKEKKEKNDSGKKIKGEGSSEKSQLEKKKKVRKEYGDETGMIIPVNQENEVGSEVSNIVGPDSVVNSSEKKIKKDRKMEPPPSKKSANEKKDIPSSKKAESEKDIPIKESDVKKLQKKKPR